MYNKFPINMIGGGFQHLDGTDPFRKPKHVNWLKKEHSSDVSIHVDNAVLWNVDKSKENYGSICESTVIIPQIAKHVISNLKEYKSKFKLMFTHDRRLVNKVPDFIKFTHPHAMPWIQNKKIYDKSKLVSFIGSNKTMCEGHKFRQKMINKFKRKVDHFGRGFGDKELPWTISTESGIESGKVLGLKDYMFSFAMENGNHDEIISQKVTDCIATGTIPIFWGSKNIVNYFDKRGIIFLEDLHSIEDLNKDLYHSKIEYVQKNLELLDNLMLSEDYLYLNYLKEQN